MLQDVLAHLPQSPGVLTQPWSLAWGSRNSTWPRIRRPGFRHLLLCQVALDKSLHPLRLFSYLSNWQNLNNWSLKKDPGINSMTLVRALNFSEPLSLNYKLGTISPGQLHVTSMSTPLHPKSHPSLHQLAPGLTFSVAHHHF